MRKRTEKIPSVWRTQLENADWNFSAVTEDRLQECADWEFHREAWQLNNGGAWPLNANKDRLQSSGRFAWMRKPKDERFWHPHSQFPKAFLKVRHPPLRPVRNVGVEFSEDGEFHMSILLAERTDANLVKSFKQRLPELRERTEIPEPRPRSKLKGRASAIVQARADLKAISAVRLLDRYGTWQRVAAKADAMKYLGKQYQAVGGFSAAKKRFKDGFAFFCLKRNLV